MNLLIEEGEGANGLASESREGADGLAGCLKGVCTQLKSENNQPKFEKSTVPLQSAHLEN